MGGDRELLELAAKAAGIVLLDWSGCWSDDETGHGGSAWRTADRDLWNPLTDDGDALRLMAKLGLQSSVSRDFQAECTDENEIACCVEPCQNATDEEALRCLRLCIVRAAAELGKAMP